MSIAERTQSRTLPPLVDGQRLDQPTFHERYAAMPEKTRAELVDGVVFMPFPLRGAHGGERLVLVMDDEAGHPVVDHLGR